MSDDGLVVTVCVQAKLGRGRLVKLKPDLEKDEGRKASEKLSPMGGVGKPVTVPKSGKEKLIFGCNYPTKATLAIPEASIGNKVELFVALENSVETVVVGMESHMCEERCLPRGALIDEGLPSSRRRIGGRRKRDRGKTDQSGGTDFDWNGIRRYLTVNVITGKKLQSNRARREEMGTVLGPRAEVDCTLGRAIQSVPLSGGGRTDPRA